MLPASGADAISPYLPLNAGMTVATITFDDPHHLSPVGRVRAVLRLHGRWSLRPPRLPRDLLRRGRGTGTVRDVRTSPIRDRTVSPSAAAPPAVAADVAMVAASLAVGTLGGPAPSRRPRRPAVRRRAGAAAALPPARAVPVFAVIAADRLRCSGWRTSGPSATSRCWSRSTRVAAHEPRGDAIAAGGGARDRHRARRRALGASPALAAGFVAAPGMATAAAVLGINVRNRRALLASLEERAERLERERDQQGRLAAAAERARIAREMHDIVAHNLSVMIALADGAGYPCRARARSGPSGAMQQVSRTGRQALGEMRRLLGVLREDHEPAAARAAARAAPSSTQLLEQVRDGRACRCSYEVCGSARARSPRRRCSWRSTGSSRRRSPTRSSTRARARSATVRLHYDADGVEVEVDRRRATRRPAGRPGPGPERDARARGGLRRRRRGRAAPRRRLARPSRRRCSGQRAA